MKRWWLDFLRLARWFPGLSAAAVVFGCAAALLEGLGLAALIPALGGAFPLPAATGNVPGHWLHGNGAVSGVVAFVVLAAAGSITRGLSEATLLRLRTEVERRARETMGRALMQMSWPAFLSMRLGDISKAQVIEGLQMGVGTQVFVQALGAMAASAAYLAIAFAISPSMTLYTLAFGAVGAVLYLVVGRWARKHADALSSIVSSIGERVSDVFFGLKFIRATGLVSEAEREAAGLYEGWRRSFFMSQMYAIGTRYMFELLGLVFIAVFLGLSLRGQTASVPLALVFLAVFYRLAPRLMMVQDSLFQARTYHSWLETWEQRLRLAEANRELTGGSGVPKLRRAVELREVVYRYPAAQSDALHGVSLVVPAGRAVGIIGASGSGKSTLLDVLTGLLAPSSGEVLLDGVALQGLDLQRWRRRIGLVQQDTPILHASVIQNIAWGEEVDLPRARESAAMAGALEFIEGLPNDFATVVGERGGRLSGGQRQRIALARALYRRPDLLILDEPTSALDAESERLVRDALERIKGRCTMLIVAHRLETVRFCDCIVALDGGRVVEEGTWAELASRAGGVMARMLQAAAGNVRHGVGQHI